MPPPFTIRPAGAADIAPVVALCARALGWPEDDPNEAFFRWKHLDNPFGPSALWVAEHDGTVVGVRAMMRWTFRDGDQVVQAARAVDTATDPAWQGRGIFRALTLHALDELAGEGVAFVFNTPNAKSRPGYLSMGWHLAGRVPVRVRPTSVRALGRVARARGAAAKWSTPTPAGEDAITALVAAVPAAVPAAPATPGRLATDRTAAFLRWRYGFAPLGYRVLRDETGTVIFRVRTRGGSREAVIDDVFAPDDRSARALLGRVARTAHVDYLLATTATLGARRAMLPAPRQGPVLAVRDVAGAAPADRHLTLQLGDVELF